MLQMCVIERYFVATQYKLPQYLKEICCSFRLVHVIGNTKYVQDSMKTLAQPRLSLIERIKHKNRTLVHLLVTGMCVSPTYIFLVELLFL